MTRKQVDKKVITAIAKHTDRQKFPLVKYYCDQVTEKNTLNFTSGQCGSCCDRCFTMLGCPQLLSCPSLHLSCYCLSITCTAMTFHIHHVMFPARLVASSFALSLVTQRGTDICYQPAVCSFFNDGVCLELVKRSTAGPREIQHVVQPLPVTG